MKADDNIVFESTYDNIKAFIKGKDLGKLVKLWLYISGSDSLNRPPDELEKEFIGEFFTHDAWAVYLNKKKNPPTHFKHIPPFDLPNIQGILAFEIMNKIDKKLKNADKLERRLKTVSEELEDALDNSYETGVFDKVDGFSNIYQVLVHRKLVKLRTDED